VNGRGGLALPNLKTKLRLWGIPGSAGTRKVKTIWILLKQGTVSGSGISWAIESQIYVRKRLKKVLFQDVDGRRAETGMTGCQMSMSSRGAMQRLEIVRRPMVVSRNGGLTV